MVRFSSKTRPCQLNSSMPRYPLNRRVGGPQSFWISAEYFTPTRMPSPGCLCWPASLCSPTNTMRKEIGTQFLLEVKIFVVAIIQGSQLSGQQKQENSHMCLCDWEPTSRPFPLQIKFLVHKNGHNVIQDSLVRVFNVLASTIVRINQAVSGLDGSLQSTDHLVSDRTTSQSMKPVWQITL